ncbi:MAG: RdgB/HAM1 family non-canonical purine NTP pyrophosphatase [Candidatus Nanopelagicales bacterium]
MIKEVLLATSNLHKVQEIKSIFEELNLELKLITLNQIENPPEVIEDCSTFTENALKKARELCEFSGMVTIADDSGLTVAALEGAPGVLSARWAGSHGDDEANLQLALEQMKEVEANLRQASFICAAAVAFPDGRELAVLGEIKGSLTDKPRGENGFGYDPIFIPEGFDITTAQMDLAQKNKISHRGIAFRKLAILLRDFLDL